MKKGAPDQRKKLGFHGEQLAYEHLLRLEYTNIIRNWRCKAGEIDIIAEHGNTLVFIEVRTRRMTGHYGTAKEAIHIRKKQQVRKLAQFYLHQFNLYGRAVRFDAITIEMSLEGELLKLEHLLDAL